MRNKKLGKVAIAGVVGLGLLGAWRVLGWQGMGPVASLGLDLTHPDALIVTRSLSSLPRDLLTIPLARAVLREEFLFYYEQNEDRLGLQGSLRRIAYEHELGWGDQLIRSVLDQPADVAVWRDADGSLKHYAIAVSRSSMSKLLEEAAKVALKDSQLTRAGELKVDGETVQVYALAYAHKRTMLIAAAGKRMVILSHPGMLYGGKEGTDTDEATRGAVAAMLSSDTAKQQQLRRQFQLQSDGAAHSVAVKADVLSLRYQPFFGALSALRFDFSKGSWESRALIDGAKLARGGYDTGALWSALPHDPAACFAVPADWTALTPVLERLGSSTTVPVAPLAGQMTGPAAVCWYGSSRLYTPVFVATRKAGANNDAVLEALFGAALGSKGASAVAKKAVAKGFSYSRTVDTLIGKQTPTLGVSGDTVVFSSDPALVAQSLAVLRKQAPAASDSFKDTQHTVGLIAPRALATLIGKEAFDTLPTAEEPVLRAAADAHLVPRLEALKQFPTYRMLLKGVPATGASWQRIEWQAAPK